jgi:hypothetical protein
MKKIVVTVVLLTVFLLSACASSGSQAFTSEEGAFSINSPMAMEETTQSIDTELGAIEVHFFMAEEIDRAYMVGYSDYPQEFVDQNDPQMMLDGARDGATGNINGNLVSEIRILLDDQYPGREIVVTAMLDEDQEGTLKAHMFLVGNRLYQVMVVAPSGELSMQEMDDFINSFKLLKP